MKEEVEKEREVEERAAAEEEALVAAQMVEVESGAQTIHLKDYLQSNQIQ
jgi:hypothetical protein